MKVHWTFIVGVVTLVLYSFIGVLKFLFWPSILLILVGAFLSSKNE